MSDGKKFDNGKAPLYQGFSQYFPRAKGAVAIVSRYGKEKYDVSYEDQNWRRVRDAEARYTDGLERHHDAVSVEGPWDPESGLLHAAHRAWNAMAVLELMLTRGVCLCRPEAPVQLDWVSPSDQEGV